MDRRVFLEKPGISKAAAGLSTTGLGLLTESTITNYSLYDLPEE